MNDCCVYCGDELSRFERNRALCWGCQDLTSGSYADDFVNDGNDLDDDGPVEG